MIPILYGAGETAFTTNGLGRLSDATFCVVTEERNGEYELEMEYPITGVHYSDIKEDRLIFAKPSEDANPQPFRIYKISRPISGIVTINAEHISYMLNKIPVMPFTAASCVSAMSQLSARASFNCPFTFWTDKTVTADFKLETPKSIRSVLGGEEPSLLSVYGKGEYEFDRFTVKLHLNRGANRGVTLRYGKNIVSLENNVDLTEIYTGIVPYWKRTVDEQEVLVTVPNNVVWAASGHADEYAYRYAKVVDFTSEFDDPPTTTQLVDRANRYLSDNEGWKVNQNIKVSFVSLWQTEEYKNVAPLEKVRLCDTVTVIYPKLDVNVQMKVIKTEYDVLKERYLSVELGDAKTNLSKAINDVVDIDVSSFATKDDLSGNISFLQQEIDHQTSMITGGLGGYVVFKYNADDQPEEILIMDNLDMEQAVNVIRMNKNGIGFSTTGYEGPFTTAWTIDGHFNADFITTGNILASLITAGKIQSHDGSVYFDLDGNEIAASKIIGRVSQYDYDIVAEIGTLVTSAWNSHSFWIHPTGTNTGGVYIVPVGNPSIRSKSYLSIEAGSGDYGYIGIGENSISLSFSDVSGGGVIDIEKTSVTINKNILAEADLRVYGSKSRIADTDNYSRRLLYCYEMPSPMFGDIGEGVTDEHGLAYISIDDIFDETIRSDMEYQVFLQPEGRGELWIQDKTPNYFTVCGDANLKFSWELKAKQRGYEYERLEDYDNQVAERDQNEEPDLMLLDDISKYLEEQEDLAYETAE